MLELLVVVSLLGIFAVTAAARLGPETLWNVGAQADARRFALALRYAQRKSIKTGNVHFVLIEPNISAPEGFRIYENLSSGLTPIDEYRPFQDRVTVTGSGGSFFNFEGKSFGGTYTFAGPDHSYQVEVMPWSGAIKVTEL